MADIILALTTAGQALNAKIQQGTGAVPLEITRIVSASGTSPDPTGLSDVVSPKLEFSITGTSVEGARATIDALLTNIGDPGGGIPPLATGYTLSQIGIYALDPDAGEILYRISQFNDNPMYVPAASERGLTYTPTLNFVTGNASTVIVETVTSGYATAQGLADHAETLVASPGGVHGIRFHEGSLQVWDGSGWHTVDPGPAPPAGSFSIIDGALTNTVPFGTAAPNAGAYTFAFSPGFATVSGQTINLI